MKRVGLEPEEVREMATVGAQRLLEVWDQEDARELVVDLASRGFFDEVKFGVFRRRGSLAVQAPLSLSWDRLWRTPKEPRPYPPLERTRDPTSPPIFPYPGPIGLSLVAFPPCRACRLAIS